jgi:hypothetical protein
VTYDDFKKRAAVIEELERSHGAMDEHTHARARDVLANEIDRLKGTFDLSPPVAPPELAPRARAKDVTKAVERYIATLGPAAWPINIKEVAANTMLTAAQAKSALGRLAKQRILQRMERGAYVKAEPLSPI